MTQNDPIYKEPSGWALSGVVFAATVMMIVGTFQAIQGLAAIIDDDFYVRIDGYAFHIDVTAWGWIHLVLGVVAAVSGGFLLAQRQWAAIVATVLAALVAIANFFYIPYYPVWSLVIIALAVWVIWSLTRPGAVENL